MTEIEAKSGIVTIDGREATSVSFARSIKGDKAHYDLTFRLGREVVAKVAGVTADDLLHVVGEKNAKEIHQMPGEKGSLSGAALGVYEGLSPELQQAAIEQIVAEREKSAAEHTRVVSPDREAFERGANNPAPTQQIENANAQDATGPTPKNKATGQPGRDAIEMTAEEAAHRRDAQLKALNKQFIAHNGSYFFKDKANKIAFEDRGKKIVTAGRDSVVAEAMVQMASAKGWTTIKISGHSEFKRATWLAASLQGLKVQGYSPDKTDLAALAHARSAREGNAIEQAMPAKEVEEKAKAKDKQGLGVDDIRNLQRKAQAAEDYNLLRPQGAPGEPTSKMRVVAKVAGELVHLSIKNPETRDKVMRGVNDRLNRMGDGDKIPTLQTWDRNAPSKARTIDVVRPEVERKAERTR